MSAVDDKPDQDPSAQARQHDRPGGAQAEERGRTGGAQAPGQEAGAARAAGSQADPAAGPPAAGAPKGRIRWNLPPAPTNPYLAGLYLGLTLLGSYLILGAGLGASGALARLGAAAEYAAAPAHTLASAYFGAYFPDPLHYYLVFMFAGTLLGGALSAVSSGRFRPRVERGPTAPRLKRLGLALGGGVLSGFAARLAQGCTSGQGLSGGALLLTGSMVFLACVFLAGFLTAWIFGRQWR